MGELARLGVFQRMRIADKQVVKFVISHGTKGEDIVYTLTAAPQ